MIGQGGDSIDPFNHPVPLYGKLYDPQVITFLLDLIQKKNHLKHVLHFYSSCPERFFMIWMHMKDHLRLQKYPIAVEDSMPITEEGMNLFSQLENSTNCVLTVLEKAWNKYVHLNKIGDTLTGRYMEKIMLAFLGAPCETLKIDIYLPNNDLEEIKKAVFGIEKYMAK